MQRFVDNVIAVTKESVKTITYESLNNVVRLINGVSAILLAILPGKTSILEGIHGWELRPTFRGPRLPRWMENGVSSFNQFIHELSVDSDTSSSVDYLSEEDSDDDIHPGSPLSQSSRLSRRSSFTNHNRSWIHWIRCILSWLLFPLKLLLGIPLYFFTSSSRRASKASDSGNLLSSNTNSPRRSQTLKDHIVQRATDRRRGVVEDKHIGDAGSYGLLKAVGKGFAEASKASDSGNLLSSNTNSPRRSQTLKDHIVQRATDRRRGVVEDLHLAIEIFIESIFDSVHKVAHCVLSPTDTFRRLLRWLSHNSDGLTDITADCVGTTVSTAVLSDNDPTPYNSLNTDARTCRDVITELGYPYEAIRVVTADGYILVLERIPRRDAQKVVYLQHGILDSSMGWVSNGIVGSPAFAAFDQGYDVFLGNLRGLVSREHVDKNISSRQYWRYSINEHGTQDIPAMIEKIHEIKVSELKSGRHDQEEGSSSEQPYKLCTICHSLGGAAILIYVITRRIEEKPHRLSRMILLSPAGFHHDSTFVFTMMEYLFLLVAPVLAPFLPAFYIPTRFFRMLLNKLARDFHNLPAVGGLVQTLMSYVVGGDSSNWVGVLGIPHYNMNDMPGVAFRVALHLAQMKHSKKFVMFDYGSAAANMEEYGSPEPLDLGEYYGFIDIPVDLVAGRKDKVIRPSMVRKHYKLMKEAGVEASYNEFEYAHLDFTFSHREELLAYVMSRLLLVGPSSKQIYGQKSLKLKGKDEQARKS
ncbi:lipase 3 [Olea europaea subsp. europaea]|uniref:Lipase 3 n=1 Tax=Olea europaea subsp. europaea TaxID=158383 RepID=A0A8S0SBU5_OLEEU|nr:lipase 3 [Olea europaea subsp. europaea]